MDQGKNHSHSDFALSSAFQKRFTPLVERLTTPRDYFTGLSWKDAAIPDNILCVRRTRREELKTEGVISNYHHRFELLFVLDQGGPARVGDTTYELTPGEAILIFPNQFHHYLDIASDSFDWLIVTFELNQATTLNKLRNSPRRLNQESCLWIEKTLREYTRPAPHGPNPVETAYCLGHALQTMIASPEIAFERRKPQSQDDTRDQILEGINTYVRAHLHQAITIQDLSSHLGYSVSHLRTVFRQSLGLSLGRYIRESRLSRAAELLQRSHKTVSEVAHETGFESLFAFSRAFKKTYGIPPKSYSMRFINKAGS